VRSLFENEERRSFFLGGEGAIACPEINLSTKLENQLAENEYPLLMLPLFYALPLQ
jgi:hypothetical protein